MKLFYSPGACSQAAHILLHETKLPHSSQRVDIRNKKTADGADFFAINAKGAVPALELDDGEVLTENGAVLQYIGEQAGDGVLLPPTGLRRYRVLEWLSYLGSDVHKSFSPLFNPASSDEVKTNAREMVGKKLDFLDSRLTGDFLTGDQLSVADPYLFAMLGWTGAVGLDLARWPRLAAFRARMMERDTVRTVLQAEGLA